MSQGLLYSEELACGMFVYDIWENDGVSVYTRIYGYMTKFY